MPADVRAVPLDADQFSFLEELGFYYTRSGDQATASKLLAICLAWRVSPKVAGDDVTANPSRAETSPDRPPHLFACPDIDESAGLKEPGHPAHEAGEPDDRSGEPASRLLEASRKPVTFLGVPAVDPWSRKC